MFYTGMMNHGDVRRRFRSLSAFLDERMRRLVAAAESTAIGYGGVSVVARATGVSRRAITEGMKELASRQKGFGWSQLESGGGAGRKRTVEKDSTLLEDLDRLVDPATRGDPESPLRWTCKSVRSLAEELQREGHAVSYQTVAELLHEMDYSLQANQKTLEGSQHADRDQQFEYINRKAQRYLKQGEPVISVDTKKKELVGDFKNAGREWQPQGQPEEVRVHDFEIREPDKGQGGSVRGLRPGPERRVGQCGSGSRHGGVCGGEHSPLVALDGHAQLSASEAPVDHGRFRRQQRRPGAVVEMGTAETGRRNRAGNRRLSFPARHQQVEQDRTPAFLFHQPELAGQAAHQSRGHHQPHRRHNHGNRLGREKQDRYQYLRAGLRVSDQQMAELQLRREKFHGDWNYSLLPRT